MKNLVEKVKEFNKVYDIKNADKMVARPAFGKKHLRYDLMDEENNEYLDAVITNDIYEVADALGDKLYILIGSFIAHGMEDLIQELFDEIHRSNMSKLDENGNPIYNESGKLLKGPNYFPPNIRKIIDEYRAKNQES